MARRAVNPGWGKSTSFHREGVTVTEFEKVVEMFNLRPDQYTQSTRLRAWVRKHKSKFYVPEDLIKAYGFDVEVRDF